ncbi:MAG TPA: ATP-binding protein [Clostridiales bacterium]|nr:ATP-binding protein [Clostridiales bacterium]
MKDDFAEDLNGTIVQAQKAIEKTYCMQLDTDFVKIDELDDETSRIPIEEATCLFQLKELVYSREEGLTDKIATVFHAVNMCEGSFIALLECKNGKVTIYIGVVNKKNYENPYFLLTLKNILQSGMQGNLPGTVLDEVQKASDVKKKIDGMLGKGFDTQCITSISSSTYGIRDGEFMNGIDNIINSIGDQSFTILILADSVNKEHIANMRYGYEELSTQLSALVNNSISVQKSESDSVSSTVSESINKSVTRSISLTESHTESSGWSASERNGGIAQTAMMVASSYLIPGGGYMYGMLSGAGSSGTTGGIQTGLSKGKTVGGTVGTAYQNGKTEGQTSTYGQTVQYTVQNKTVSNLYNKIERVLEAIEECDNTGMFSCCAYILSNNPATNKIISSHYQSILRTAGKNTNTYGINTWTQNNGVESVRKYLCKFMHPRFYYTEGKEKKRSVVEPSVPISGRQLALHTIFPHKAVPGLPVVEYASFGRNIVRSEEITDNPIAKIGNIYHMGKTEKENQVYLDMQSLASHTFIAGTNGSGKTNTVYKLLEEIHNNNVKFLVIEPAKGEYKNAFGHYPDLEVYGTNPQKTPLLKLNPFKFNKEIHVLEHIDKLIEVFNACWPMYAAMPAVLKAAVENAYISCGWNMKESKCRGGHRIFPTIRDVLRELTIELDSSAFSGEVRGNYVGALTTRLESLCKGLFGQIFSGEDLGDEQLFEKNVIIDLSRAFSTETKAMLMGILILRLQEHRMSGGGMNLPLKHVTILEEAHHLLRRTSSEQSQEGSNLLGKSVEMIANSIAEMRTYGEGFIIVDQSPGLLDMSVIRNTNTKILLRLPEFSDRELTGRSMGLNPQQIDEIPRLKKGVCVIYQNDWLEAVLCKIGKAENSDDSLVYQYDLESGKRKEAGQVTRMVRYLISLVNSSGTTAPDIQKQVCDWICTGEYEITRKRKLLNGLLFEHSKWGSVAYIVSDLLHPSDEIGEIDEAQSKAELAAAVWANMTVKVGEMQLAEEFSQAEIDLIIECILWSKKQKNKSLIPIYRKWFNLCEKSHPPEDGKDLEALKLARGHGAEILLVNMTEAKLPTKQQCLESIVSLEKSRSAADQRLAEILRQYVEGQQVAEWDSYSERVKIAYEISGGNAILNEALKGAAEDLHVFAVRCMRMELLTNRETEISILNSALLYGAKDIRIKKVYQQWFGKYGAGIMIRKKPGIQ